MLSAMDDNIGRVLETLRKHKSEEQTLIFCLRMDANGNGEVTSEEARRVLQHR